MRIPGLFLLLWLAVLVQAQGTLKGRVLSAVSGKPLTGASIEATDGTRIVRSDTTGRFRLDSLPPGSHDFEVRHGGYLPGMIHNVIFLGDNTEEREVELFPDAQDLGAKKVTAKPVLKIYDMPNSTRVMDAEEIRRTPGALMDVQRVVQKFPGVQSRGDNVNEVIARGGFPGENLFILDNIEIPNPNYFGNQGTGGGVISVVNPLMVKKLTFNTGVPPARYGGKASSVLDIDLRDGNDKMIFGGLDLGFAGAGFLADGPLWPGATFLSSFRKSFLDVVAEFEPSTAIPEFQGGQAKVTQKIASGKIIANGLAGESSIRIEDAEETFGTEGDVIEAGGEIYAVGGTVERYAGDEWEFSATVSGTGNLITRKQYFKAADTILSERKTQEYENAAKAEAEYFAADKTKWTVGGEFKSLEFRDRNRGMPDTLKSYISPADTLGAVSLDATGRVLEKWFAPSSSIDTRKYAIYASMNLALENGVYLAFGARGEGFGYSEDWFLMPRASARWVLNDEVELTSALGMQTQTQNFTDYAARPENSGLASKRAAVASLELDWYVKEFSTSLGLNVYAKRYDNLVMDSILAIDRPFQFQGSPARLDDGTALSRGLEVFVERKLARNWFSSVAYAYSVSETRFDDVNGGRAFPSDFDYTHLANVTGGAVYDLRSHEWYRTLRGRAWFKSLCWLIPLGDRLEASARVRYATGRPRTPLAYDAGFRRWRLQTASINGERYPDYQSLDLRFERRIGYGWLRMMFYFDFQNVLNRNNVFAYVHNDNTGKRVTVDQLPFFPMGGFIIGF